MLRHLGDAASAQRVEAAVQAAVLAGETTSDLGGSLGTAAAGEAVLRRL
ncbi:MAG: 3-isopropylmalate dehydrogenase, partial [Gemmatimonadetes bacterium]|nr:3-isopropylmalate dehydrogenase [Gemmatimonadota bacterium]